MNEKRRLWQRIERFAREKHGVDQSYRLQGIDLAPANSEEYDWIGYKLEHISCKDSSIKGEMTIHSVIRQINGEQHLI